MSDSVERLGTSEVKIRVSIPWSDLEASYRESLSKVRSSVQVRGFRPGKAPQAMIEKMMGERLAREVAVDRVGERVQELIRREKIMPLRVPLGIDDDLEMRPDREAIYEATVEVLPMIDRIAFDGLELVPRREVTPEDLSERIRLIAARKAPLETAPADHSVGEYDQVVLQGQATFKDDEAGPQEVKDMRVDLAPWSEPPPALVEQLKGRKAGDAGEVDLLIPEKDRPPRYAHLVYTVSEVITRRVPEIDEDLAKDFDMESLAELESMVRESMEKEALDEYIARNGDALVEQLLDRVRFDLPPSYRGMQDPGDEPAADEGEDAAKAREQRKQIAELYDRFARRNLMSMILAFQNDLKLPEETMRRASEQMRGFIDEQEGSRAEKDRAYEQWRREFEQSMFNKVISTFLVQEVERCQGIEAPAGDEAQGEASGEEASKDKEEI